MADFENDPFGEDNFIIDDDVTKKADDIIDNIRNYKLRIEYVGNLIDINNLTYLLRINGFFTFNEIQGNTANGGFFEADVRTYKSEIFMRKILFKKSFNSLYNVILKKFKLTKDY